MSEDTEEDDEPYWLDGMTPEEQLAEIDEEERRVRAIWANAHPGIAKAAVGSLANNLNRYRDMRARIARGLHPTRPTPEEKAQFALQHEETKKLLEEIRKGPPPPGYKPYKD